MPIYETLQYIGSFDLEIVDASLGDIEVPHGGAMYEFYKVDTSEGQRFLNLKFKVLPDSGSLIDAGDAYGGLQTRYQYIRGIYRRNRIQQVKPITINGPDDGIDRRYKFADPRMSFAMVMSKMYASGVSLAQWRLPGVTGPEDPMSAPADF